jgi:ATP-dependent protease ClpP protease subunit
VSAGQEIYSTLLSHKKRVNIHIEGLAASAASIIAMAGTSEISPVGMVMIHNVSGGAQGDYHVMKKSAEVLKQYNAALCAAYCAKTGKKLDAMLTLMDRETWLTADQAVKMGFVDRIMETKTEQMVASEFGIRLTQADIERAMDIKAKREAKANEDRSRKESIMSDLDKYGV